MKDDLDLADLTSQVEGNESIGIGNYSGSLCWCWILWCACGWT